jgi:hypothetical protein
VSKLVNGTAVVNANFSNVFANYYLIIQILHQSERIYARRIYARRMALTPAEQHTFVLMDTDIDGCVVELATVRAIDIPVRH